MLQNLFLSLAVAAAFGASILDTPNRAVDNPNYEGHYLLELQYADGDYYCQNIESPYSEEYGSYIFDGLETGQTFRPTNGRYPLDPNVGFIDLLLGGTSDPFVISIYDDAFSDYNKIQMVYGTIDDSGVPAYLSSTEWEEIRTGVYYAKIEFWYREPPVEVIPDFTLVNCTIEGMPSHVWVGDNLQITVVANEGYGLPNSTGFVFDGEGYSQVDFVSEWEPIQEAPFLFNKVAIIFRNISTGFAATLKAADTALWALGYQWGYDDGATTPTDTAYQNGYRDGERTGYQTGYVDGKKDYQAGGIWSWFESAAIALGSFLDIKIFPSFTIGNLIGALVGLTIIMFFIRAFLFKG